MRGISHKWETSKLLYLYENFIFISKKYNFYVYLRTAQPWYQQHRALAPGISAREKFNELAERIRATSNVCPSCSFWWCQSGFRRCGRGCRCHGFNTPHQQQLLKQSSDRSVQSFSDVQFLRKAVKCGGFTNFGQFVYVSEFFLSLILCKKNARNISGVYQRRLPIRRLRRPSTLPKTSSSAGTMTWKTSQQP
jgi:hypothetical protein